jgi:hypothetical protein
MESEHRYSWNPASAKRYLHRNSKYVKYVNILHHLFQLLFFSILLIVGRVIFYDYVLLDITVHFLRGLRLFSSFII